jgi:hypothetical protein
MEASRISIKSVFGGKRNQRSLEEDEPSQSIIGVGGLTVWSKLLSR